MVLILILLLEQLKKDILNYSKSIDNRLFFSGEGTSLEYMGYLNGAYESGIKQANDIKSTIGRKKKKRYLL